MDSVAIDPADDADPRLLPRRPLLGLAAGLALSRAVRAVGARGDSRPEPAGLRAQRLAWAGVRLELAEAAIYVDPLADREVWGPALTEPFPELGGGPAARFVLVTHLHPDHFDPEAVARILGSTGTLVCDAAVAADAASRGFRVRGARPFEPLLLDDFAVTAVPAVDGYGVPQISWVVSAGGRRVIHCGDTLWHGMWWQVGRLLGPFDAAFLPINGARFGWRQPAAEVASVMTPEQAVAAAVVLGARLLVPIHHGVSGAAGYEEEPRALERTVEIAGRRGLEVQPLKAGEWVRWPEA